MSFVLGGEVRRCEVCEARFICRGPLMVSGAKEGSEGIGLGVVLTLVFAGVLICAAIALYILRRFHRWPF